MHASSQINPQEYDFSHYVEAGLLLPPPIELLIHNSAAVCIIYPSKLDAKSVMWFGQH